MFGVDVASAVSGTDLTDEDQSQLSRLIDALPLLADVAHADQLLCVRDGDDARVIGHSAPAPVPSLYPRDQTSHVFRRGEAVPVLRVLQEGKGHDTLSGSLIWGAPTLQEAFRVTGAGQRPIASLVTVSNLLEHVRLQRRDAQFRGMVARVCEEAIEGRLIGAGSLGRFTEHDGAMLVDQRGIIRYMNSIAENQYRRVGYPDSLVGEQIAVLDTSENVCFRSMERGVCLEQRIQEGDQVWIKRVVPLFASQPRGLTQRFHRFEQHIDGAAVFIQDITEEVRKEQELKTKSAMIQEVHHRVKNNLQTLALLLRMQARRSAPEIRDTLDQTIGRVVSIAVVHEFLSRGESSDIDIRAVCGRIADEMSAEVGDHGKRVNITVSGERYFLPAQQATSCALAVNELLHNAVEHGFANRDQGTVEISMLETDGSVLINVSDDGDGLPEGFDLSSSPTLGLSIVRTLVQDDLRGRLQFINGHGVTAQISFPKELCRLQG